MFKNNDLSIIVDSFNVDGRKSETFNTEYADKDIYIQDGRDNTLLVPTENEPEINTDTIEATPQISTAAPPDVSYSPPPNFTPLAIDETSEPASIYSELAQSPQPDTEPPNSQTLASASNDLNPSVMSQRQENIPGKLNIPLVFQHAI